MILIFISWLYILFTTINLGFLTDKILHLKNQNFAITVILGLFSTTILASFWAVFGRINIEFHVFLFLLNIFISLQFKTQIITIYKLALFEFQGFQKVLQVIFIITTLLIIAQCSTVPYVIDNESYYIQTIKWINEYGFVKGLINLHIFFSQTSGWHITQSVFNFSFLYSNLNDLSGFCLFIGTFFFLQKLNDFYRNRNINYLIVGLFPIFNIFLFQFISAPSPDIPVYVFSFIIFFYFLDNFKETTKETFNLIIILTLFTLYIKNTALVLAFIPILLLVINFKTISRNLLKPSIIAILILFLFVIKNLIICGSPIFPSKLFSGIATNYIIPTSIESFYYDQFKTYGFFVTIQQYSAMSYFDLFLKWISLPKLNGLFNKTSIVLILILPFLIYKFQNKKSFWILYSVMLIQMIFLFITSPQYRFFTNFILFFSIFCLICIFQNKKIIFSILIFSSLITIFIVFVSFNLNRFSNHNFMIKTSSFSKENIVFPHKNTKYNTAFIPIRLGNFTYNSPINCDFFWAEGDGNLPCVNKDQIEYFKKYFNIIPQMRTNNLKDGFYAKELSKNE